jgi:hypothetical protein
MRLITCILSLIALVIIVYGVGTIQCYFQDTQQATSNTFTAFSSNIWTQTTLADFEASGLRSNVDTSAVPGDVLLEKRPNGKYRLSGNLRSSVFDTGITNAKLDLLSWDSTLPAGTTITFRIRARNTYFAPDSSSPSWTVLTGSSPISTGLPTGRYVQWRAYLTTSDNDVTPALHEVQVWYH